MNSLREDLNSFNYHFDAAAKSNEAMRVKILALEKAASAAAKRANALEYLFSSFSDESCKELLGFVDTLGKGMPIFSRMNVMAAFAKGFKESKEYTDFIAFALEVGDSQELLELFRWAKRDGNLKILKEYINELSDRETPK